MLFEYYADGEVRCCQCLAVFDRDQSSNTVVCPNCGTEEEA
jgi:DNA-directed RNA polymerase subunit RPC12/RpoP